MEEFVIRDATPGDCGDIRKFIVELAVYEKEPESRVKVTREQLIRDGFESEKPWFHCVVGEIKSRDVEKAKVIGYALFFPTYSTWNGPAMKLEDLYIQAGYRKRGYGMKMIARVNEIALSQNCARLHWNVLDWNKPAVDMYTKIGAEIHPEWNVCVLHEAEMKQLKERMAKM